MAARPKTESLANCYFLNGPFLLLTTRHSAFRRPAGNGRSFLRLSFTWCSPSPFVARGLALESVMNRRIVGYSTLASVAVSAVAGVAYLCWLPGIQAEDAGLSAQVAAQSTTRSTQTDRSAPDPLFTEPVQIWRQERNETARQPAQNTTIVRTAFSKDEPRRLQLDAGAKPLAATANAMVSEYTLPPARAAAGEISAPTQRETAVARAGGVPASIPAQHSAVVESDPLSLTGAPDPLPTAATSPQTANASDLAPADSPVAPYGHGGPPAALARTTDADATASDTLLPSDMAHEPSAGVPGTGRGGAYGGGSSFATPSESAVPTPVQEAPIGSTAGKTKPRDNPFSLNRASAPATGAPSGSPGAASAPTANQGPAANRLAPLGATSSPGAYSQSRMASELPPSRLPRGATGETGPTNPTGQQGQTGSGRPGSRHVEGPQSPQLVVEKLAPAELQVGKRAKFELHLRNTGAVAAQNVEVRDLVPEGTQFIGADPPAEPAAQGELVWRVGTLKAGEEKIFEVELMPIAEGEVGSVAVVSFAAEAGVRSRVTRPDLTVQVSSVKEVMIGEQVKLSIRVANPGTGPATGVVLFEHVPSGLKHQAGPELEFEVGTLKPGETRDLDLVVTAAQAGRVVNQLGARADAGLKAQAQCELEVLAPALAIEMDGPSRRYLERQATYTVSVSNPGTATAKEVELVTRLPRGLKFVSANNAGHYDAKSHTVTWSLAELPPAETGTVMLTAIPTEPGEQRLRAEGRAQQNLSDEKEQITTVEGVAAVLFEVMDIADPVEVKGEAQYEIRVTNQGSKAADNVQLAALLPPELKFISGDGPTRVAAQGQVVRFEPIARLAPKADVTYRIVTQGLRPGDLRIKVQLMTADLREPVTKEESTRVYADE
jgi:uncharacterized repeat protein (TIGR01451 family)